jgi:hypothetical protein
MSDEHTASPDELRSRRTAEGGGTTPPAEADEFAGIEPYRPRRSPILAAAVILISGYLLFHLRHDLAYALRSRTPTTVGDVRAYFREAARIPDNGYVTMRAIPDRASAIMLDVKGQDEFVPFMRVGGTGGRLLLAQRRGLRPLGDVYDDVYAGRLMRLADVSYAPTVRAHYAGRVTATRFFRVDEVRGLLARRGGGGGGGGEALRDVAGDAVPLGDPARLVGVDVTYRGDYDLTMPRDRFPAEADARNVLDRLGVEVKEASETATLRHLVVHMEDPRRDAVIGELTALDSRVQVLLRKRNFSVPWGGLAVSGDGLVVPAAKDHAATTVPWDAVTAVTTIERLTIPTDAFVLVEGERPQDLWYVPVFALCFVLFVIWNLLALWATRGRVATRRPQLV